MWDRKLRWGRSDLGRRCAVSGPSTRSASASAATPAGGAHGAGGVDGAGVVAQRLLQRLQVELRVTRDVWRSRRRGSGTAALGALAAGVRVVEDRTRWAEVFSHSARQGRAMPVSGLVGELTFGAEPERLAIFLPWLVWGELAHAGKDATKGNGRYCTMEPGRQR